MKQIKAMMTERERLIEKLSKDITELCNSIIRFKITRSNIDRIHEDEKEIYEKVKNGIAKKFQYRQKKESYLN